MSTENCVILTCTVVSQRLRVREVERRQEAIRRRRGLSQTHLFNEYQLYK